MFKKKTIVITGALGQDGVILSKLLLKKNYYVFGIIKKVSSKKVKNVSYHKIDLLNYDKVSKFIDRIDPLCLIHLGTENPNYIELKRKKDYYKNNLKVTKNLIKYFSLNKNNKKVDLKSKFYPVNSYAKFRVESHKYMIFNKKKYSTNMTTAILFNHDSLFRKKKFLIPRLIKLINSKKFKKINEIYQENISGDFSHAEDVCNGLYKLIVSKKNPDKLIFSSNKNTYINDIINFLLKKNKIKKFFKTNYLRNNSTPVGDNSYTKKLLNWKIKKDIFVAAGELNKL